MKDSKAHKLYFCGTCSQCSETYEAHSRTDDLEGVKFLCKKMFCRGEIVLRSGQSISMKALEQRKRHENPRRFC